MRNQLELPLLLLGYVGRFQKSLSDRPAPRKAQNPANAQISYMDNLAAACALALVQVFTCLSAHQV